MTAGSPEALIAARHRDSSRRRQRVLDALGQLTATGKEISVSAVARAARVDRSFLYRHHDLRAQVHARAAAPGTSPASATASRLSLLAGLANLQEQTSGCGGRTSASPPACLRSSAPKSFRPAASGIPAKLASYSPGSPNLSSTSSTASAAPGANRRTRRRPRRQPRPHGPGQPETPRARIAVSSAGFRPLRRGGRGGGPGRCDRPAGLTHSGSIPAAGLPHAGRDHIPGAVPPHPGMRVTVSERHPVPPPGPPRRPVMPRHDPWRWRPVPRRPHTPRDNPAARRGHMTWQRGWASLPRRRSWPAHPPPLVTP